MFKIKRVKRVVQAGLRDSTATHWVVAVGKLGNITGLTPDPDKAGEFAPIVADAVKAYYADRPAVGELEFITAPPPLPPATTVVPVKATAKAELSAAKAELSVKTEPKAKPTEGTVRP